MSIVTPFAPESDRVRGTLGENLPWSPLDFIPGLDARADREMFAEHMARPLDPADDLRFIHGSEGEELAVIAERLPWDSAFFGYGVARLVGIQPLTPPYYRPNASYSAPVRVLLEQARARDVRYLFAQVDARDLALLRALGGAGFEVIETRLTYHHSLAQVDGSQATAAVRAARPEDVPSLARAARETINPFDRFHADPFVGAADAARLMSQWMQASVCEGFADYVIVPDMPEPAACLTAKYHREKWARWKLNLAQGVFTVVGTELRGWYRKLESALFDHMRDQGAEHVFHVTQATNKAVLWVWETTGQHYGKTELVLRVIL